MDGTVGARDAWRLAQEAKTFMSHLFPAMFLSFSLNRENAQVTKYRIPFPITYLVVASHAFLSKLLCRAPLQKKNQGEYVYRIKFKLHGSVPLHA